MHVKKSAAIFRRNKKRIVHLLHTQSKNKQTNQNMLSVHKIISMCEQTLCTRNTGLHISIFKFYIKHQSLSLCF